MDFYVKLLGCLLPIPDEAELHFLFRAANCHFLVELQLQRDKVFM